MVHISAVGVGVRFDGEARPLPRLPVALPMRLAAVAGPRGLLTRFGPAVGGPANGPWRELS